MSGDTTKPAGEVCTATSRRMVEATGGTVLLTCDRHGAHHNHRDPERGYWSDAPTVPADAVAEVRRLDDAAFAMWQRGGWDELVPKLVPELREALADAADRVVARWNAETYHPLGYSGMAPVNRPWRTAAAGLPRCPVEVPEEQRAAIAERSGVPVEDADWRCYLGPHYVRNGEHTVCPSEGGHPFTFTVEEAHRG
jgi:hypothetical protein